MSLYHIETNCGTIKIQESVLGRIIINAVNNFKGRVKITNQKGKIIRIKQKYGTPHTADIFDMDISKNGVDIRFYVAIRFGQSIGYVTEKLINDVKSDLEDFLGIEANSIAVIVTGLISNKIAPRNIEVVSVKNKAEDNIKRS